MQGLATLADNSEYIGYADKPYTDRIAIINAVSKKMSGQNKYTFSGYVKDIHGYGDDKRYLHVAQRGGNKEKTTFEILGPSISCQSPHMIMEISKRNANGSLPSDEEQASTTKPSIVINYAGYSYTIPLAHDIAGDQWHHILDSTYDVINKKCDDYLKISNESNNQIPAGDMEHIVLQVLQEKNIIASQISPSTKKTISGWKNRLFALLGLKNDPEGVQTNVDVSL